MSSGTKRSYGNAHNAKRSRTTVTTVTGYNRATGGMTAAARVPLQKAVAAAVRKTVEKKGMDTVIAQSAIADTTNSNANITVLNLIQQGAGSWNRIGRKVNLKSIRVKGFFTWLYDEEAVTGNVSGNWVRMVLVWDKQPSGAAIPTWDTIFGCTEQNGTESSYTLSQPKYDNMDRFQVLRDVVTEFKPQLYLAGGSTNTRSEICPFDEFVDLKGREVVFLGQSNPMTIADISTGALYLIFRTGAAVGSTNQINVSCQPRLRYTDP